MMKAVVIIIIIILAVFLYFPTIVIAKQITIHTLDYPTVLSSTGGFQNADSHTILNLPNGIILNDMIIFVYEMKITAFVGAVTVTGNGTWTQLSIPTCADFRLVGFWHLGITGEGKIHVDSGAGTVKQVWSIIRIGGPFNSTMPPAFFNDNTFCGANYGAGLHPDPPALNVPWGNKTTLWLAWASTKSVNQTSPIDQTQSFTLMPVNYINVRTDGGLGLGDPQMSVARRNLTANSENPAGFTLFKGDQVWFATTIAIQPNQNSPLIPTTDIWNSVYVFLYATVLVMTVYAGWWIGQRRKGE